ncbi:MAG: glucose-6-phosphate isomerase [Limnochordales bacterium]|nr:glucose-6-phosphate isomerase [Limnochordales bacterium]
MEKMVRLDTTALSSFVSSGELDRLDPFVRTAHDLLRQGTGAGADFRGWLELARRADRQELERILAAARRVREKATAFVVVGIGGSYLGARAAIEMLLPLHRNEMALPKRNGPRIYFLGNHLSPAVTAEILALLEQEEVVVNVISKSGTTTEPALSFRLLREQLLRRYGREEARRRILVTTDREKGALRKLAAEEGYETFTIPDDVGGRYSVLTPVGLLPMAVAGIDVEAVLAGAAAAAEWWTRPGVGNNEAYQYAALRNILARKGRQIELLVNFDPHLHTFGEWWKQLFGESEGKDGKGLYPASADFTTDLHSLGQYIQEGARILIETVLHLENQGPDLVIPAEATDIDGLEYLAGRTLGHVNEMAFRGTVEAHVAGGVPVIQLHLAERSAPVFGQLVFFFEVACAISGYLLGVNPFDQPGVEAYKRNMFRLLGKPGI